MQVLVATLLYIRVYEWREEKGEKGRERERRERGKGGGIKSGSPQSPKRIRDKEFFVPGEVPIEKSH